jgi:hypothetical protein
MKAPAETKTGVASNDEPRQDEPPPTSTRLAVNITPTTKATIDRLVEREGVTQTEAVRRLISYGDLVYRTTQIDADEILIRRGDTFERIVLI